MIPYDCIVIGAGPNGLTAAAYLAKAGRSVLVLERRDLIGGLCVGESLEGGLRADPVMAGGFLRPGIFRDLDLGRFGLEATPARSALISLQPGVAPLVLDPDPERAGESIARFSRADAAKWPAFVAFMDRAAGFLDVAYETPMPRLPKPGLADAFALAALGMELRAYGRADMLRIIRALPMTAQELLDEWFESEVLKAAVASLGIHNANLGVMSAGSAFNLIHNWYLRGGPGQPVVAGGVGRVTAALAEAARSSGAEIRTGAEVSRIVVMDNRATAVVLASGEEIAARSVISSADPKRTFLGLVTPEPLDPTFVWNVQNIKMRGVTAKVHLSLDRPDLLAEATHSQSPAATYVVAPSLDYLERAYDAAKYGQVSEKPYLEVTTSGSAASIHLQYAPYHLKDANWDDQRESLADLAISALADYIPNLKSSIVNRQSLTPLDLERTYALTEGDPNHGQLMLDQFLFMRPLPGWSDYRTPVEGLYLCGSGAHGGGGISGIPGRNAANRIIGVTKPKK